MCSITPEADKNLQGLARRIGALEGLRLEAALRIAQQNPADRYDRRFHGAIRR